MQANIVDRLILVLILVIMTVSAFVNTLASQRVEDTVRNTNLITDCITEGTECYNYQKRVKIENQNYLRTLMKTTNICLLIVSRENPDLDIDGLSRLYDGCVEGSTPPAPTTPDAKTKDNE